MSECCNPIVPPPTCKPRCNPLVSTDCVVDPSGYACLEIPEESTQSEINAAIISALCSLSPGTICPTFTDIDTASGWVTPVGGQDPAASDPIGCIVRLHGVTEKQFSKFEGDSGCHKYQITLTNTPLPVNQRPTFVKALSVLVSISETTNPGTNQSHFSPGLLVINTSGTIILSFYVDRCVSSTYAPFKALLFLDGLTYETN